MNKFEYNNKFLEVGSVLEVINTDFNDFGSKYVIIKIDVIKKQVSIVGFDKIKDKPSRIKRRFSFIHGYLQNKTVKVLHP